MYVSDKTLAELQFWLSKVRGLNSKGRDISENTSFEVALFCDASSEGYGGYLESNIPYYTDRRQGKGKSRIYGLCRRFQICR